MTSRGVLIARHGADYGHGLHIGDFGSRRFSDWGTHQRLHNLAQPAIPSTDGHGRARPGASRRSDQAFHHRAVSKAYGDAIINSELENAGVRRSLSDGQPDEGPSMTKTIACADVVMHSIVETYFTPNGTLADLRTSRGADKASIP